MHNTFRVLGQKVGIQNIRGILPESIDILLNDMAIEKARSIVRDNTSKVYNDKVAMQDASISPINALRSLYRREVVDVPIPPSTGKFHSVNLNIERVMYYTAFAVDYIAKPIPKGCRFIEPDKLYDTLDDYCSRASWDYPIISMFANNEYKEYVELHIGETTKVPNKMYVHYIELPSTIKLTNDPETTVDCNLPEYLHYEIVEGAVTKYFKSLMATAQPVAQN